MALTPSQDEHFLRRALALARQGIGVASPNPCVGAVIVDSHGGIVGSGSYTYSGVKHAEVLALDEAGEKARGGSLYINLEPHGHQGRTPPCTDALIAAGIRRVVACMADPNPKVSDKGFEQLRAAGISVEVGQFETEARRLNEAFARYIRHSIPLVTLKSAMSLDARIALPRAEPAGRETRVPAGGWITGETARVNVHLQRHASDAILVGIGTILADDPLLTDRSGLPRRRPLLRVILDSRLRLPVQSRIVQSANAEAPPKNDVLVFCSSADPARQRKLQSRGIRVEQISAAADGRPDAHAVLRRLGELEIISVLVEGGATVNAMVLAAKLADKVFLYYAPMILGDGSLPFARNPETRAHRIKDIQVHRFENDIAIEGYLRDPYE